MSYGYAGKIAFVDLTTGEVRTEDTADYERFLGGRMLGAKLYWDNVPPECGPFDPENCIIFATGILAGTGAPSTSRTAVITKAATTVPPAYFTGGASGKLAPRLKFCGFDALVVSGKAASPVYLWVHDDAIDIKDAKELWGEGAVKTLDTMKRVYGDNTSVAAIGQAGENGGAATAIIFDKGHASGCGGTGGIMGSKMLKALVVDGNGTHGLTVANPEGLLEVRETIFRQTSRKPNEDEPECYMRKSPLCSTLDETNHWVYPDGLTNAKESGEVDQWMEGCWGCPMGCMYAMHFNNEALPDFRGHCQGVSNMLRYTGQFYGENFPKELFEISLKAHDLGLTYNTQGHAFFPWLPPLIEAGVLTEEDLDLPIPEVFGEKEWLIEYYENLANQKNEYYKQAAKGEQYFWDWLLSVRPDNKEVISNMDTQVVKHGYGYYDESLHGYAVHSDDPLDIISTITWFRHGLNSLWTKLNWPYITHFLATEEEQQEYFDMACQKYLGCTKAEAYDPNYEGIARLAMLEQNTRMISDSVQVCNWCWPAYYSPYGDDPVGGANSDSYADLMREVTGEDRSFEDLVNEFSMVGYSLERAIHAREGRRREHDMISDGYWRKDSRKSFNWVLGDGPAYENAPDWLTKDWIQSKLDDYYALRGWDPATGVPTRSTLESLGLGDVAEDLAGKYGVEVSA